MSAFVTNAGDGGLPLTGERTIPGLAEENYWFRRHEVVYLRLRALCAGRDVLEAGCGEGYGADLIASAARRVIAVDYDAAAVAHVRARYPRVQVVAANLASLPLPDASVDVVVNFQVIEHLWDQPQFVTECLRVLRPGGLLLMSTPNRVTFSPGRDTPVNPFHTRELNAAELAELLTDGGVPDAVDERGVPRCPAGGDGRPPRRVDHRRPDRAGAGRRRLARRTAGRRRRGAVGGLRPARTRPSATSTRAWIWWRSRCARERASGQLPGRCAPARRRFPGSSASSCTPTCPGWPITAAGRSARSGSTSRGRRPTCR